MNTMKKPNKELLFLEVMLIVISLVLTGRAQLYRGSSGGKG